MSLRKPVLITVSLFVLLSLYSIIAAAGVSPLVIDVNMNPGETQEFKITLTPGEKPEKVAFNLYKPIQLGSGGLTYEAADNSFLPAKWVNLPKDVSTKTGENTEVTGTVKVPFSAGGSYIVIVMVEPDWDQKATGISFRMRYAVRLNIRVSKPGIRATAEIRDFKVSKTDQGEPKITASVANTSLVDYLTSAEVTIRDSSKRLVDRVELKPEIGWSSNLAEARLYPGATVDYYGSPTEALLPGKYDLRLFYRYGTGGQLVKDMSLEVEGGDYTYPAFKLKSMRVSPLSLEFEGKPGTTANKPIKLENRSNQPLKVETEVVDILSNYPYSVITNTGLEVRGDKVTLIEPGRTITKIVTVKYPKDAVPQGNYGTLKIQATSLDGKFKEESTLDLTAIVTGTTTKKAEVSNLSVDKDGTESIFSAVVTNAGAIEVKPSATLMIKDAEGRLLGSGTLNLDDGIEGVLPLKHITMTGIIKDIKPGTYTAEIKLTEDKTELGTSSLPIQIQ